MLVLATIIGVACGRALEPSLGSSLSVLDIRPLRLAAPCFVAAEAQACHRLSAIVPHGLNSTPGLVRAFRQCTGHRGSALDESFEVQCIGSSQRQQEDHGMGCIRSFAPLLIALGASELSERSNVEENGGSGRLEIDLAVEMSRGASADE